MIFAQLELAAQTLSTCARTEADALATLQRHFNRARKEIGKEPYLLHPYDLWCFDLHLDRVWSDQQEIDDEGNPLAL